MGVNAITPTTITSASSPTQSTNALSELGTDDFLGLLITQLRTQDPLEPMGNQELMNQLSAVRDIQASTSLTEMLGQLAIQQRFASASGLMGQFVTGKTGEDGASQQGTVVGIRFMEDGRPMLQLAEGGEILLDQVEGVESPLHAAEALIGKGIVGVDRRPTGDQELIEGVVMAAQMGDDGEILMELDSGKDIRFRDVIGLNSAAAA
jgi:flagellar basal-body rod modification protein FlgD